MGKCFVSPGEGNAERKRKHKEARNKTVHANPVQHKKKGGHKKNNGDEAVVTNPADQKAGGAPMPPDDAPDAEAEVHYNPWSPSDILARCPPDKIPKALKLYAEHYEQHVFNLVEYHPVVSAWATKVKNTIALNHHRGVNCPRPEFERVGGYNVPAMFKAGKSLPATPSGAYNIYLIEGVVGADGCFIGYDHDVSGNALQPWLRLSTIFAALCALVISSTAQDSLARELSGSVHRAACVLPCPMKRLLSTCMAARSKRVALLQGKSLVGLRARQAPIGWMRRYLTGRTNHMCG